MEDFIHYKDDLIEALIGLEKRVFSENREFYLKKWDELETYCLIKRLLVKRLWRKKMMDLLVKQLLPLLEKGAPIIASALLDSKLNGWATYFVCKVFGVCVTDVKNLPEVIRNSQDKDGKIAELESKHSTFFSNMSPETKNFFGIANAEINIKLNFENQAQ
jgi:hypothetical protein